MLAVSAMLTSSSAYVPASAVAPTRPTHNVRQRAVFMDETIMEKALAGELEQEGAENVFMSELGWATYLDQNAGGSYNMNQRPSMAEDGYFTADIFSNGLKRVASKPLAVAFPSISNDESGARSYPKGYDEIKARTIRRRSRTSTRSCASR